MTDEASAPSADTILDDMLSSLRIVSNHLRQASSYLDLLDQQSTGSLLNDEQRHARTVSWKAIIHASADIDRAKVALADAGARLHQGRARKTKKPWSD
jgi:hypothetical protein